MTAPTRSLKDLFLAALDVAPTDRAAWLERECPADVSLRDHLRLMLAAHDAPQSLLDRPGAAEPLAEGPPSGDVGPTLDDPIAERPGTMIGPYKLLEQIGEGGFGVVFMAEQTQPIRRRVALKVLKPGMDTRQVVARFEAERQALALMDHPNIAKVFDGGTTGEPSGVSGRVVEADETRRLTPLGTPYFVMELVKGVPITKYCDEHHLTPRQRLELFIPVCQAVQHAHQKGIIHRDLKPSNVLVALYDGKPVPKVIDFGVAKATGQQLTEETLHTGFGAVVGTLEYMSPEQAEVNQLDVDTRSDIYSLGVLLYELLAGSPPFRRKDLEKAGMLEMLRVIREQEPSKPSTKLSTAEGLPTLAANRGMEPAKLTKLVRGELDWIVMKALEKDRNRRYETANGFAMDVQRYLADEAVQACPPSAWYRFRKFARRNKRALTTAAMLGVALIVAVGAVAGSLGWVARDRAARQMRVAAQVDLYLGEVKRLQMEQKWSEALTVARQAESILGDDADSQTAERVQWAIHPLEMVVSLEDVGQRLNESPLEKGWGWDREGTARRFAAAFRQHGVDVATLAADDAAAQLRVFPEVSVAIAAALDNWAAVVRWRDREHAKRLWNLAEMVDPDAWRVLVRQFAANENIESLVKLADSPELARQPPQSCLLLAQALYYARPEDAVALLERACDIHPDQFWLHYEVACLHLNLKQPRLESAVRHFTAARALRPLSAPAWCNLGVAFKEQKKFDHAVMCLGKAVELRPLDPILHNTLGVVQSSLGHKDEAIARYLKAIELNPKYPQPHNNLGNVHRERGNLKEAIACYNKAIELSPTFATPHANLGLLLFHQDKVDEAMACYHKALELGSEDAQDHSNLGLLYAKKGQHDNAIAYHEKAIAFDPNYALAHNHLGAAFAAKRQFDNAIAAYKKSIELNPKYAEPHNNLGSALQQLDQLDQAVPWVEKAVALDPNHPTYHLNLAHLLLLQDKPDAALKSSRHVINLDSKIARAHHLTGLALAMKGDFDEAIAPLRKAFELDSDTPEHRAGLALPLQTVAWRLSTGTKRTENDAARALALAKELVELTPKAADAWTALGAAHYRSGDWKAALEALEKGTRLRRSVALSEAFFMVMAHWQLAEYDTARAGYERAVQWMDKTQPKDAELLRLRNEAAELLGVKGK